MENLDEYEVLGRQLMARGLVVDLGGGGGGEMSPDDFETAGHAAYDEAMSKGRVPNAPRTVSEGRDECLAAAFREGLVPLSELSEGDQLMVLKSQHAILTAAVTPAAPAASKVFGQKRVPASACIISAGADSVEIY